MKRLALITTAFLIVLSAGAQELKKMDPAKASLGAADKILEVSIDRKRLIEQDYQEYVYFDLEYMATGLDKPARAVKGTLHFFDLFDEIKMRLNWTINDPIKPGDVRVESGGFEYNQYIDRERWVANTSTSDMKVKFVVESIIYQDGTRKDLE